jgi:GR25 family glycosyltransferase involved in LPS biosynthesis
MVKASVFAQIGPFNDAVAHFEHDYAERFYNAGLRAAFFDGVYSLHTGRLTSQRGDPTRANAYDLNGEAQFNGAAVAPIFAAAGLPAMPGDDTPRGQNLARRLGMRVINLDRRPDRLESFRRHVLQATGPNLAARIERFAAIDGRDLSLTVEIQHLFRGNDFNFRRAVIGTALSHMAVWRDLARSANPAFLILEDDVTLCPGFEGQLVEICGELTREHPAFDAVLLGYFDWRPQPQDDFATGFRPAQLRSFDGSRFIGGTFAYILSRGGAEKLIAIAGRDGIQNGIDRFVHRKAAELEILVTSPKIVEAQLVVPGSGADSDIQNDFTPLVAPGPR